MRGRVMKISVLDASNYFKGLLLLIRKDRKVSQSESDLMKRIGKTLGFEKEFCDDAIRDILANRYIDDTPPDFSTRELAVKFIKDGFSLAFADNEFDPSEEEWLRSTAERNGIEPELFSREQETAAGRKTLPVHLEVDDLTVM
jgi:tellurite resistance protein